MIIPDILTSCHFGSIRFKSFEIVKSHYGKSITLSHNTHVKESLVNVESNLFHCFNHIMYVNWGENTILRFGYAVLHKLQVTPVTQYSADSTSTHA